MEDIRCFIRSTVSLVNVAKWNFFIDWSKILRKGLTSVVWYHCTSFGLILAVRELSDAGYFWLGGWSGLLVSLTCHMPDVFDQVNYNTVRPSFTT